MKTSELTGATLDWAVAKCEAYEFIDGAWYKPATRTFAAWRHAYYAPSERWESGGPIIEREKIDVLFEGPEWYAYMRWEDKTLQYDGPTPLIAAMRCYVASKLGDDVELPEELQ